MLKIAFEIGKKSLENGRKVILSFERNLNFFKNIKRRKKNYGLDR